MKFAQATAVRLAHWLTRAGLLLGIVIGALDLTGCAGVAVQQFDADWTTARDLDTATICSIPRPSDAELLAMPAEEFRDHFGNIVTCQFLTEYVASNYSDEWLEEQVILGTKWGSKGWGKTAKFTLNNKAAGDCAHRRQTARTHAPFLGDLQPVP